MSIKTSRHESFSAHFSSSAQISSSPRQCQTRYEHTQPVYTQVTYTLRVWGTSVQRSLFLPHKHKPACTNTHSDSVLPLSLLLALSGPQIPRVQLYYKAQDQEQRRVAYFRKRVAPLLLDMHTHRVCRASRPFYVFVTHDNMYTSRWLQVCKCV